jgi:HSP20 family protein
MALEPWQPRCVLGPRSLFDIDDRIDDLFGSFPRMWPGLRWTEDSIGWTPPVDLVEHDNELVLRVDLPGLDREDVQLTLENGMLTLRGRRERCEEERNDHYHAVERWSGPFSRTLTLPAEIDAEKISSIFNDGVLKVRIPKTETAKSKQIHIKTLHWTHHGFIDSEAPRIFSGERSETKPCDSGAGRPRNIRDRPIMGSQRGAAKRSCPEGGRSWSRGSSFRGPGPIAVRLRASGATRPTSGSSPLASRKEPDRSSVIISAGASTWSR